MARKMWKEHFFLVFKEFFLPAFILIPGLLIYFEFLYVENLDTSEFSKLCQEVSVG